MDEDYLLSITKPHAVIDDLKGFIGIKLKTELLEFIICHLFKPTYPDLLVFEPKVFEEAGDIFLNHLIFKLSVLKELR